MPVYEYACAACGLEFEEWQKISDKPIQTCPKCKARKVERLISRTSFQLKGGGWYKDLYAGPKPAGVKETAINESPAKESAPKVESQNKSEPKDKKPKNSGASASASEAGVKAAAA